jgi:hypothetical protein
MHSLLPLAHCYILLISYFFTESQLYMVIKGCQTLYCLIFSFVYYLNSTLYSTEIPLTKQAGTATTDVIVLSDRTSACEPLVVTVVLHDFLQNIQINNRIFIKT